MTKKGIETAKSHFVQEGDYQGWTNTFSRKTVLWDKDHDLLTIEVDLV